MSEILLTGAGRGAAGGSVGPSFAGTIANDASVGVTAWTNPGNATIDDGSNAEVGLSLAVQSQYLKLTNFGFAVPGAATIVGIKVVIDSNDSSLEPSFSGEIARLVVAGSPAGNDKGADWELASIDTLGGSADLWGLSLTPADVNAADFGLVLAVTGNVGRGTATARIDYVTVEVFYV